MSVLAANPAGFSHLSPCPVEQANASPPTRNYGCEWRSSCGGDAGSNRTAIAASFFHQSADDDFALERVCRYVSRLLLGHPFGVSVPPKTSLQNASQNAAQTSFGPLPESRPSALGAGPTR